MSGSVNKNGFKFLVGPLIFITCLWLIRDFHSDIPKFAPFSENKAIEDIVPVIHITPQIGFQLGKIQQQYNNLDCEQNPSTVCVALLNLAKKLTKTKKFDATHFGCLDFSSENHSALQRLVGLLSLANVIWVIGTLLVVVSIGPFIVAWILPVVGVTLFQLIILLEPLYEVIAYTFSLFWLSQSFWYPDGTATFVAFTGCLFGTGSFFYSSSLHLEKAGKGKETYITILCSFVVLTFGIPAVWFNSSFLGFVSCGGVLSALGFVIIPTGMCTVVGFDGKNALERSIFACSFFLLWSLIVPNLKGFESFRLVFEPFRFGIHSIGVAVLLLGMLIVSSRWYASKTRYFIRNGWNVALLSVLLYIGNVYDIPSLVNNAGTFGVLFAMEKYAELRWWEDRRYFWLLLFLSGIGLWPLAMFVKTHPEWIMGMFVY